MRSNGKKHEERITKASLISFFSILAVSLFPGFFMYFYNAGTASLRDFIEISIIIAGVSIAIFALSFLLIQKIGKAALITNTLMIFLLYFAYIEEAMVSVFPMLYYWHIALICLFIFIHIVVLIHNKVTPIKAHQFNNGLFIIFLGLILFNGILAIPKHVNAAAQIPSGHPQYSDQQINTEHSIAQRNLPNIYFFIFDEYGGYDNLRRYCDYDNTNFYDTLDEIGFITSKHSVNGTIDTLTEMLTLLHLQRANLLDATALEKIKNFKNPYLFTFVKENGYSINALDSSDYHFLDASQTDTRLTPEFTSTYGKFQTYIIEKTAYYPLYGSKDHENEINKMIRMFEYGEESSKIAKSNLFTIGYFAFPHVPFIVDEQGNKTSDADRLNLVDSNVYLGQLKYSSKRIVDMVREIVKNDPNSIIILQSDHGYRLPSHLHTWYGINRYDLAEEAPFERNILNAVYYSGERIDIEGLSGLNTLKVVFNALLDANFEVNINE